jgi:OFA family oxalate/formate antiporter-like MFS transporter
MTKYVVLVASVLIQVCIGGLYAWSEFVPALEQTHGLSTAQTQLIFGTLIAVFTVSMVFAGRLLNRIGPRWVAAAGGVAFGAGYGIASRSGGGFGLLLLGIGVIAGIGTGFCYVCPLTMCVKWFPRRKGLVTGVAVAGFGGGAVVLSYLSELFFEMDMGVLEIFESVGLLYGAVILLAALTLRLPQGEATSRPPIEFGVLTRDRHFWGLALGMFSGTFAGLLVIGNLKPMILSAGIESEIATAAISGFAVGNAFGRISWGWVADRIGARAIPLSLSVLAGMVLLLWVFMDSASGAVALSVLLGVGFGACFIVYAAQTASHYGTDHLGAIYPLIFLAYGLAGLVGPGVGGWIKDQTESYAGGLMLSFGILLVAIVGTVGLLALHHRGGGAPTGDGEAA